MACKPIFRHAVPWIKTKENLHPVQRREKDLEAVETHLAVCQNLVPLVNIKIAGKWMFIPLEKVLIGIDPYPFVNVSLLESTNPPMTPRFTRQLLVECIFFAFGKTSSHWIPSVNVMFQRRETYEL